MVDIFDEVDEDLRAERAQKLLKRYGGAILAGCLAIVAAAGGWQMWRWQQARQDMAAASAYVTGMMGADVAASNPAASSVAATAFESLTVSAPDGYKTLARLRAASLRADAGDLQGATSLWDLVAGDTSADTLLRDLASLLWASRQLDQGDPALLEARLRPLAAPGNAWRSLAAEQLALLDLRQGKIEPAKAALLKLADDPTAQGGVRARASALAGRLR